MPWVAVLQSCCQFVHLIDRSFIRIRWVTTEGRKVASVVAGSCCPNVPSEMQCCLYPPTRYQFGSPKSMLFIHGLKTSTIMYLNVTSRSCACSCMAWLVFESERPAL